MVDKNAFKDIINYVLVAGLFILAAIIIYPVIYAIIYGILLAYVVFPIYKFILKRVKNEFLSATFVCVLILILIVALLILIFGSIFSQAVDFYLFLQKVDFVEVIRKILPGFIASSGISENIISSLNTYMTNLVADLLHTFTNVLSNIPELIIKFAVFFFTFFYALKDGEKAIEYFKSLSPLKKETEEKFFKHFKDITSSVLLGQILVGVIQGLVAGIGYYIFGVNNALLLTLVTVVFSIIPIFGAVVVWVPVVIYMFIQGNTGTAVGLLMYGILVVSWIDNIIRTWLVSRKTQINIGIVLIGMLGGLFVFGFLGLIIGPLIIAYVLLVLELYRKSNISDDLIFKKPE